MAFGFARSVPGDVTLSHRGRRARQPIGVVVAAAFLATVTVACFALPLLGWVTAPIGGDVLQSNLPMFSPGHVLGTDANGNDTLSRLLHGGRTSLETAVAVNLVGLLLGGGLGAFSARIGGIVDSVTMRVLDVLIAFPSLVLVAAIAQVLGPSQLNAILALSMFSIPAFARVARASTLSIRERPFMLAAELAGTSRLRSLLSHVAPNILPHLVTFAVLGMGIVIIIEGALSFVGLGVPPPQPTWGNMIAHGQQVITASPEDVLLPSMLLFLTALSFNLLGEALRARLSRP